MADGNFDPRIKPTREMFDLYDRYCHGIISRRAFMDGLSKFAVGGLTVAALAGALLPRYAEAQQVTEDDARVVGERIVYPSPEGAGEMGGYLVRPVDAPGPLPAVLVVHENRGLNPHIADVARRAALAGYLVLAPDALYPLGGYPGTDDAGRELQAMRDAQEMLNDFMASARLLQAHEMSTGKVGVTGFCYGGGVANALAARIPDAIAAAVPFYGAPAAVEEVPQIQAPLLIHLGGLDERINAMYPPYEAALRAAGKDFTVHVYEGANHGFHNDTTPRFDPAAAELAWRRTLEFFRQHLA